jgi:hypothetical protein
MKTCAIGFLLIALAVPANAALTHDEAVDGDLSTNPAAPTALAFAVGSSTVTGTTGNFDGTIDRDYITFTIAAGQELIGLNLLAFAPDNIAFASFNAGATSYVPSAATALNFLSGTHIIALFVGTDLMPLFVSDSVTGNSLPLPELGPGTYSFLIQQTSPILQSYSLEFVVSGPVPTAQSTWGTVKALYQ